NRNATAGADRNSRTHHDLHSKLIIKVSHHASLLRCLTPLEAANSDMTVHVEGRSYGAKTEKNDTGRGTKGAQRTALKRGPHFLISREFLAESCSLPSACTRRPSAHSWGSR